MQIADDCIKYSHNIAAVNCDKVIVIKLAKRATNTSLEFTVTEGMGRGFMLLN